MIDRQRKVIAAILAGGKSSRMGSDKNLLQIDAKNLLLRTFETIKASSISQIVVSGDVSKDIRNSLPDIQYVKDLYPNKGPLSGIHSLVTHFRSCDLLIVPVDLPLLDPETLQALINIGEQEALMVRYKDSIMPLYIPSSLDVLQYLEAQLAQGKLSSSDQTATNAGTTKQKHLSIRNLIQAFPNQQLALKNESSLFNVNTPQDWQEALLMRKNQKE